VAPAATERDLSTAYDEVAYPTTAFRQTHPDRLATHAALLGLPFAPPARCRVLDVGGGDGMNLIGMALTYPGSEFVGFDLSQSAVRRGQEIVRELGLANVRLFAADVTDVDVGEGAFDYLIAHGFYSWVPAPARDAALALAARCLAPAGVAFVSYNAQPGGHIRRIVRDLLLFETQGLTEPGARIEAARRKLQEVVEAYPETDVFQRALKVRCQALLETPGAVMLHDDLGDIFHPVYLTDFLDHAAGHGLRFLTEADPVRCLEGFAAEGQEPHEAQVIAAARETDFKLLHGFRQTLLVHAQAEVNRRIVPRRLAGLHASCAARPVGDGRFRIRGAEFSAPDPQLSQALAQLTAIFPLSLPVKDLVDDDRRLGALMRMYAADLVGLHVEPSPFSTTISERPRASPLARLQIALGEERLITLSHTVLPLEDPIARGFLTLVDGSRTQAEITREMARQLGAPEHQVSEKVAEKLSDLAKMAMLIG